MATTPYFVLSPNTVLSLIGLLHGPDPTVPTPPTDWHDAVVDVVIPAFNEAPNIALCLASLQKQTIKPRNIILIDDGSSDATLDYAKAFCQLNGMELIAIHRQASIGKTPTLKRQAREFDADVEFILDGDTVLESPNYIERAVQELYQGNGIASACGVILPLRDKDRRALADSEPMQHFLKAHPDAPIMPRVNWFHHLQRGVTDLYRDVLYFFLQRFVYHGQQVLFGSMVNPVGCAVAYKRADLKQIFDHYEPILGDDLTNSEDIFIGFALNDLGYRNIQLTDVFARSQEPEAAKVPKQIYLWSSAFLQSCYYFDDLLRSPFKVFKRWRYRRRAAKAREQQHAPERRQVSEAYRYPFGHEFTREYGRPVGWVLFLSALEKITFPAVLLIFLLLGWWEVLAITLLAETVVSVAILTLAAKGRRWEYFGKGLLVAPLRYGALMFDLITVIRFVGDLWLFRNRQWRK